MTSYSDNPLTSSYFNNPCEITCSNSTCSVCEKGYQWENKLVCSNCIYDLLQKFKEKENFCKENGDPIMLIAKKLNEHAEAINALNNQMNKLLTESK